MTDNPLQSALPQDELDEGIQSVKRFRASISNPMTSRYGEGDSRLSSSSTVFPVDDAISPSLMPRPLHWSVVWSDLMMTMFILFLVMYAYQQANEQFLQKKKAAVIGGDTTEALQTVDSSGRTMPFAPIRNGLPLMTAGKIKKVEPVHENIQGNPPVEQPAKPNPLASDWEAPLPPVPEQKNAKTDNFQEMYTLGKDALENNNLNKFASIDIVPDKTMRIILTGDLLFNVGQSDLSATARNSLVKVVAAIRNTPYMINVVGHTDNTPMRSNRFNSNWELSLARASTVARYLIEEIGMDPNQFVVSGYSSYRPVEPNTTADNRAKNRRVEIIISKRLPPPVPATAENLN